MYVDVDKLLCDYCNNEIFLNSKMFNRVYCNMFKEVEYDLLYEEYLIDNPRHMFKMSSVETSTMELYKLCNYIRMLGIYISMDMAMALINAVYTDRDHYKSLVVKFLASKISISDLAILIRCLWGLEIPNSEI